MVGLRKTVDPSLITFLMLYRLPSLIHVRIISIDLYLTHDSVCNYTFSYKKIQVKGRIGIIFESFITAPFWCDAG